MTKDEKQKERFVKWRKRIDKSEAKISSDIFKTTSQKNKLWKTCPHKWESSVHNRVPGLNIRISCHFVCDVCGAMRPATIEERCIYEISER